MLEREPAWARARLFQAVARVLAGGDAAEAAALAREAAEALPDDWDGRRIAVLVRAIAGQDVDDEIERIAVLLEAHAPRTIDEESP